MKQKRTPVDTVHWAVVHWVVVHGVVGHSVVVHWVFVEEKHAASLASSPGQGVTAVFASVA